MHKHVPMGVCAHRLMYGRRLSVPDGTCVHVTCVCTRDCMPSLDLPWCPVSGTDINVVYPQGPQQHVGVTQASGQSSLPFSGFPF